MNLSCSKDGFIWVTVQKHSSGYELHFLHFESFSSCQNGIKKFPYKYGSNNLTKHPA